ncbi:hypothetical protein ABRT01_16745 [Lentibacillus sp. L22]|uniref:hypothetical protein n=1 Tax=Lentibacillus sp. L22 TaxID=3163028 RepID=UPI0022B1F6D4|nr:hypothetical protein [Lentibacillus daqui]
MATIVFQTDKRSGITYAYESISYWDKNKQQSRSKRTLIGRVDSKTGKIVPTDGRGRKKKEGHAETKRGPVPYSNKVSCNSEGKKKYGCCPSPASL